MTKRKLFSKFQFNGAWIIDSVRVGGPKGMQVPIQVHVVTASPGSENAR